MKMKLYNLEEYMVTLQEVRIPAIKEHVILDGKEYIVMCVYNDFDRNCFHVFMRRANDNDICKRLIILARNGPGLSIVKSAEL